MTTIGALLIMAVVGLVCLAVGFIGGIVCSGYIQKVRNEEAGRKIIEQWHRNQPQPPETEATLQ